ncbi:aldo/keto reductase [Acaricomes phytoseiuli]|uniref:aldo/keto reductase n=1 Tax=Acaricomes phytoseiuli TaxID=291968 RepID=UPI000367B999|nr:aldo/keto reductase [Acaricomes phytoseiuli]MCW1248752.1 aldo/keto reductase [Acaricomes phytoseiuli]
MQQRFLGRSGLRVSVLSLGTATWGAGTEEADCRELLTSYVAAGGTVVDSAAGDADGRSEELLGALLDDVVPRDDLVLVSRAGVQYRNDREYVDCSRKALLADLDASLARLGTDYLDIWLPQHWDPMVPLEETLGVLDDAVASGRVRYAGVSNYAGWQLAKAAATAGRPIVAGQIEYSLLNRSAETELLPAAQDAGIGLMCWGPLGRGVLTAKYRGRIPADSRAASELWQDYVEPYLSGPASQVTEALSTAAKGLDREPFDVALSWLLNRSMVSCAIIGPRTPGQLTQLLAASLAPLPEQISSVLDEVSQPLGQPVPSPSSSLSSSSSITSGVTSP